MRPFVRDRGVQPSTSESGDSSRPAVTASPARAVGALALGALALGALAIGAIARLPMAIGRARVRRLEIDELIVRKLRVTDDLHVPDKSR